MSDHTPLTYKDAGVDIEAGDALVEKIKIAAAKTKRPEVMSGLGGFGALVEIPSGYKQPVLVSGTDGVGTKLKLAMQYGKHDTIGIDLVAMCVNDIVVSGAEPLLFLDYYATGKLNVEMAAEVIIGIAKGCELAGCALVGGETAEMPGMYEGEDYDLAGFCVGVVEKSKIIDGSNVHVGDRLVGLKSSGVHSNGYSLVRKIIERDNVDLHNVLIDGRPIGEILLEPTRIYAKQIIKLARQGSLHAMAHITGGGITENLPRVLPKNVDAVIHLDSWKRPEIFDWLQSNAHLSDADMLTTFNCGIGMILVVPEKQLNAAFDLLAALGEHPIDIGQITQATGTGRQVHYRNR